MRSYEFTAKSVEKAIEEGLEQLGKKQEEVDIKIVSEGGFLKKAKIVISIEDEPVITSFRKEEPKPEVKDEVKTEPEVGTVKEEAEEAKTVEEVAKPVCDEKVETKEEIIEEVKSEPAEEVKVVNEVKETFKGKKEKSNRNAPKTQEEIEEQHRLYNEKHFENNSTSVEFISGLVKAMGQEAQVSLEEKRDASEIKIEVMDVGKIIGHKGECLSAIQYLANVIEGAHNPSAKRVVVDAGDYKQRREETLRALAIRVASKVEHTGRPYRLEPMNAFERRIVHTELHNYASVETHSEGVEPFRRIIVTKKK
ncbi:MAG TPA: hypothetical protein DCO89_02095 [Clostridiales bacterium]|nr:hypothetical protein [Clostridiales bacterium]